MAYSPLDEGNDEIRVLRFKDRWRPDSVSKPLRMLIEQVSLNDMSAKYCNWQKSPKKRADDKWQDQFTKVVDLRDRMIHHSLPGPTDTYRKRQSIHRFNWGDYEALSYAWGEQNQKTQIVLDNNLKLVSLALEAALRRLHRLPETRCGMRYWVDQLCINQDDLEERNHQVKRIKKFYNEARAVVVWLGTQTKNDEKVLRVIRATYRDASQNQRLILPLNMDTKDWMALCEFMRKPYWQRLWIIQELAANANATIFLCGSLLFTRKMVKKAADCCQKLLKENAAFTRDGSWDMWTISSRVYRLVNLKHELAPKEMLRKALNLARQAIASEVKDKVYGVLGLLSESYSSQIIPDYSDRASVQQVFTELTIAIIRAENTLEQIIYGTESSELGWPSWVPDLRVQFQRCHIKHIRNCSASKKYPPQYHFLNENSTRNTRLCAKGIRVDTIDGITASQTSDDPPIYPSHNRSRYTTEIGRLLRRTLVMDHPKTKRRPAYMTLPWSANRESFSFTNRDSTFNRIFDDPHFGEFQRFRRRNQDFRIGDRPLRDYFPDAGIRKEHIDTALYHLRLAVVSLNGRRLATTCTGYMCLVPETVLKGDVIVILFGCNVPLLLRQSGGHYRVVGECFVLGLMKGEIFETEGLPTQTFTLI